MSKIDSKGCDEMRKTLQKCILISLCAFAVIGIAGFSSLNAGESKESTPQTTQTPSPLYTFSQYQGRLALYQKGYAMPVEIYDVYLDSLPEEDRLQITQGISADSDAEIQKIIEDYTS